jgi:hypothetical protein
MSRTLEGIASISAKLDAMPTKADVATAIGKIETVDAKLADKVNTRTAYSIAIAMAVLIVAAASGGGISRLVQGGIQNPTPPQLNKTAN